MLKSKFKFDFKKMFSDIIKRLFKPAIICSVIILVIKNIVNEDFIKFLSIESDKGIYLILTKISNYKPYNIDLLYLLLALCLIVIILRILLGVKEYFKMKMLIIKHCSLNSMNVKIDETELKDCLIKDEILDQYEENILIQQRLNTLITKQREFIKCIKNYLKKNYCLGYAGIAHTPFVFLMGYVLGDENKVSLFHKRRDNSTDDYFHLLTETDYVETLNKIEIKNNREQDGKILLCIETTFSITDDEIKSLKEDNDYILRYSTQNKNFDVISSMKQINQYVVMIKNDIQQLTQSHKIQKIKICISSSIAFTFALGQAFSINHDPEIEVFHFDKKDPIKYPWGINVTTQEVVINKKDHEEAAQ